jgi:hypothetical protein
MQVWLQKFSQKDQTIEELEGSDQKEKEKSK